MIKLLLVTLILFTTQAFAINVKVVFTKGEVFVKAEKGAKKKLKRNGKVSEGDTIFTSEKSFVILKFDGHSTHRIEAESVVAINSLPYFFKDSKEVEEGSSFTLKVGTILSDIIIKSDVPAHKVETKNTVMGIRGTKLLVSADGDNTWLAVKKGEVEVFNDIANAREVVGKQEGLVIESDARFTSKQRYDWAKDIDWDVSNRKVQKQFNSFKNKRKQEFKQKRKKWRSNKLVMSKKMKEWTKKEKRWERNVSKLEPNKERKKQLKRRPKRQMRRRLMRHREQIGTQDATRATTTDQAKKQIIQDQMKRQRIQDDMKKKMIQDQIKRQQDTTRDPIPPPTGRIDNK